LRVQGAFAQQLRREIVKNQHFIVIFCSGTSSAYEALSHDHVCPRASDHNNNQQIGVRNMKIQRTMAIGSLIGALCISAATLNAQDNGGGGGGEGRRQRGEGGGGGFGGGGGGNFDPAQFQQRMMERMREELSITNDTEWTAIQPLVQAVNDARREVGFGGGGFRVGGGRQGGGGGEGGGRRGGGGFGGGQPNPEAEALQKAIEDNAPSAQIKDLLTRYQASQKAKQDKLANAQNNLRKVLTVKQEAKATLMGLLN
jgi:hypothetical protein